MHELGGIRIRKLSIAKLLRDVEPFAAQQILN